MQLFDKPWPKQREPHFVQREKVLPGASCASLGKLLGRDGNNRARGISAPAGKSMIERAPRGESGVAVGWWPGGALDLAPSRPASAVAGTEGPAGCGSACGEDGPPSTGSPIVWSDSRSLVGGSTLAMKAANLLSALRRLQVATAWA